MPFVQRRRFAQMAAVVALGLGVPAFWIVSPGGDHPRAVGTAIAHEPLFPRLVFAPGDDPSAHPLTVGDAYLIEIDRTGALLVHSGARVRRQPRPRAYQDIDGRRHDVSIRFELTAASDPHLVVGPYDRTSPLVIEPETGKDDLQP